MAFGLTTTGPKNLRESYLCYCHACCNRQFPDDWPPVMYGALHTPFSSPYEDIIDIPLYRTFKYPSSCGCIDVPPYGVSYQSNEFMVNDAGPPGSSDETCCAVIDVNVQCINNDKILQFPQLCSDGVILDGKCYWTAGMAWTCGDVVNFEIVATEGCDDAGTHFFSCDGTFESQELADPFRPACIAALGVAGHFRMEVYPTPRGGGTGPTLCKYACCQVTLPPVIYVDIGPCDSFDPDGSNLGSMTVQLFAKGYGIWEGSISLDGCADPMVLTFFLAGCIAEDATECTSSLYLQAGGGAVCIQLTGTAPRDECFPLSMTSISPWANTAGQCGCCPVGRVLNATVSA